MTGSGKGDRVMGRIGGQVDEERLRGLLAVADEVDRGVEKDLLRPTVDLFPLTVVEEVVVDAVVEEMIVGGAGAAVALAEPLVEAAVHRAIGKVRSEMPLAEHRRAVAVARKASAMVSSSARRWLPPAMVCHT